MITPKYITKNGAPEPRYICPRCIVKRPDLEVHMLSCYVDVTCCICGKVGTHQRLTNTSSERVSETK